MRKTLLLLSLSLLACGESVTDPVIGAPKTSAAAPAGGGMHDLALGGDEIVITRTTEFERPRGSRGGPPRREQRTRVTSIRSGEASVRVDALPSPQSRALALAEGGELPLPRLSAPSSARHASRGAWTRSVPYLGRTDAIVQSAGVNDEPASEIRLVEDGRVTMHVRRTWHRGVRSWLLESQRVEMPEMHFAETMTVRRTESTPVGPGASRQLGTFGLAGAGRASAGRPLFDEGCDDANFGADPCQAQKDAAESADEDVLLAGFIFIATCALTSEIPLAGTYVCVGLLATFAKALKVRDRADAVLKACRDQQLLKKDCGPSAPFDESTVDYGPGFGDGGVELSGGATAASHECRVYFEYDMATGDITYMQVLYCW